MSPTTRSVRRKNRSLRDQNTSLRQEIHQLQTKLHAKKSLPPEHEEPPSPSAAALLIAQLRRQLSTSDHALATALRERDAYRDKLRRVFATMEDAREMSRR